MRPAGHWSLATESDKMFPNQVLPQDEGDSQPVGTAQTMARKVLNRKALREEADAAEKASEGEKEKQPAKKKAAPRKSRAKAAVDERKKLFWGVFSQSLKRVALFEYSQRKQADKKAEELSKSGKSPHFVQKVKEVIDG